MSKIKKHDKVKVIVGKDKGKIGTVEKLFAKDAKAIVSGVNMVKRHVRRYQNIEGGIIDLPKPIDISNIMLVCPNCDKPTRVGFITKDGIKSRACKLCQGEIK